ncbi:MAG TPA: hypothetical protein VH107_02850 [Lacipirellulaceae bacterium]|jgi:hypothetical protein|nr:hypothetical protein [Lacipirellulaceae bacterium]
MSYPHSKPNSLGDAYSIPAESIGASDQLLPFVQSLDTAVDTALRSVPLPDGMLTRLQKLAFTVPDEAAGRMDYLGC